MTATPREIVGHAIVQLPSLLAALGFDRARARRTACVLCGATNRTTFSFDSERGVWHCFRCGAGGGVLDLVQAVHGFDREGALRWLSHMVGVPLDRLLTRDQRRDYPRRCATHSAVNHCGSARHGERLATASNEGQ